MNKQTSFQEIQPFLPETKEIINIAPSVNFNLEALLNGKNVYSVRSQINHNLELECELESLSAQLERRYKYIDCGIEDIQNLIIKLREKIDQNILPNALALVVNPEHQWPHIPGATIQLYAQTLVDLHPIIPNQIVVTHSIIAPIFCNIFTEVGLQGYKYNLPNNQIMMISQ